jgi:hypothetical protein
MPGPADSNRGASIERKDNLPFAKFKSLNREAHEIATAGEVERAKEIVLSIPSPQLRVRGLVSLSETIAVSGDGSGARNLIDEALKFAGSMTSVSQRRLAFMEIALHVARSGDPLGAEKIVQCIVNPSHVALAAFAVTLAGTGELERAERIARSISDLRKKEKALAAVVAAGVGTSNLSRAETIARSITDVVLCGKALDTVARALAGSGDLKHAEGVARSIVDFPRQAQTLIALTSYLGTDEARILVASALMIAHWQTCLPALMRIEPEAVAIIADEYRRTSELADPAS